MSRNFIIFLLVKIFKVTFLATTVCFEPVNPCPSRDEVFESMKKYGLFEMREKEELRHGVFMSDKDDLGGTKFKSMMDILLKRFRCMKNIGN